MPLSNKDVVQVLIAFFFPPLAVLLKRGCGLDFVINILLSILGFIPGLLHAWYLIFKFNDVNGYSDLESGGGAAAHERRAFLSPQDHHGTHHRVILVSPAQSSHQAGHLAQGASPILPQQAPATSSTNTQSTIAHVEDSSSEAPPPYPAVVVGHQK